MWVLVTSIYKIPEKFIIALIPSIAEEIKFQESLVELQCASDEMDKVRTK